MSLKTSQTIFYLMAIGILYSLFIYLVNPFGEYPFIDDFSFIDTVKRWDATGKYVPNHFTSMALIFHALWGLIFVKLFGFSVSILKLANLIMGFLGLIPTFLLFKEILVKKSKAFWLTIFVMSNFIFLSHVVSFMTDITYFSLTIWSVYLAFLFFKKGRQSKHYILFLLFSVLGILTREFMIFSTLAFAMVLMSTAKKGRDYFLAILLVISVLSLLMFYKKFLKINDIIPSLYGYQTDMLSNLLKEPSIIIRQAFTGVLKHFFFFGLFLFVPVLAGISFKNFYSIKFATSSVFGLLIIISFKLGFGEWMPFNDDVFIKGFLYFPVIDHDMSPSNVSTVFFNFLAWVGASLIFYHFFKFISKERLRNSLNFKRLKEYINKKPFFIFLISFLVLYLLPFLVLRCFTRYYIIPVFLLTVILLFFLPKLKQTVIVLGTFLNLFISTALVHDYHVCQKVRWSVINQAHEKNNIPFDRMNMRVNDFLGFTNQEEIIFDKIFGRESLSKKEKTCNLKLHKIDDTNSKFFNTKRITDFWLIKNEYAISFETIN